MYDRPLTIEQILTLLAATPSRIVNTLHGVVSYEQTGTHKIIAGKVPEMGSTS